jgi:hypothetical protein
VRLAAGIEALKSVRSRSPWYVGQSTEAAGELLDGAELDGPGLDGAELVDTAAELFAGEVGDESLYPEVHAASSSPAAAPAS